MRTFRAAGQQLSGPTARRGRESPPPAAGPGSRSPALPAAVLSPAGAAPAFLWELLFPGAGSIGGPESLTGELRCPSAGRWGAVRPG